MMPENFKPLHAEGPSFTMAAGELNAWTTWDNEDGIKITLDVTGRGYTLPEVQTFHAELSAVLNQIKETP